MRRRRSEPLPRRHELATERGDAAPSAYVRLAAAVLLQAIEDVHDPMLRPDRRAGARAFLTRRSTLLEFWCAAAGLELGALLEAARELSIGSPADVSFRPASVAHPCE